MDTARNGCRVSVSRVIILVPTECISSHQVVLQLESGAGEASKWESGAAVHSGREHEVRPCLIGVRTPIIEKSEQINTYCVHLALNVFEC